MTEDEQARALYRERAALVAYLAAVHPAAIGTDPAQPDWPVVYVDTPAGQMSWHISRDDLDLFPHVPAYRPAPEWDGHTTEQKYDRLRILTHAAASRAQRGVPDPRVHGRTRSKAGTWPDRQSL